MTPRADASLELLLRRADTLVSSAAAFAVALEDLAAIELPPPSLSVDQAQLRALAVLYLAAELEGAGAIPAAEALVRLARSGGLVRDFGDAAALMQMFWQARQERISSAERLATFNRLFGSGATEDAQASRNTTFEDRMIDLCEALYRFDESGAALGGVAQQTRVRNAAGRLMTELIRASSGFTALVAQEVLTTLRQSLAILGHAAVKAAFGARDVWDVVTAIDRLLRQPSRPHALHLRRGQAGMTLLAWLADSAPRLDVAGTPLVTVTEPVIEAAVDWLESSLALGEAAPPPATPKSTSPGSNWATIAG